MENTSSSSSSSDSLMKSSPSTDLTLSLSHTTSPSIASSSSSPEKKASNSDSSKTNSRKRTLKNKQDQDLLGVSTTLKLYEDPWKIKKILNQSDLGSLSRLLLANDLVEKYVLPVLGVEEASKTETIKGTKIRIWDSDTGSNHELVFKRWNSSKSYVFIENWTKEFVKRRELKKGDEIGFYWDSYNCKFNFSVLKRAPMLLPAANSNS
ncbi:B3 domain-containing protein [Quillaja saponaria]|uniref:B3 domain-containing protein n=1 Tax=Quillaja saponaria TaxID=32244 RepID=A0AAD7VL62_QUISA|nr:B3 domain-containing protein [Quillaja saponaria]